MTDLKTVRLVVVLALAVLLLSVSIASAQSGSATLDGVYDLSWWTVDGGGGTLSDASSGYTLSGTAGQPDAATWRGEGYTLAGGFWGGAVVEYAVYLPLVLRGH